MPNNTTIGFCHWLCGALNASPHYLAWWNEPSDPTLTVRFAPTGDEFEVTILPKPKATANSTNTPS